MIRIIITLLFVAILFVNSSQSYAREISIAIINYEPYYGEKLENDGFIAEIVKESLTAAGHTWTLKYYPWDRALAMVKYGKIDALIATRHNIYREKFLYFPDPLSAKISVFYRKIGTDVSFDGWKSLKKYRVGGVIQNRCNYPGELKELNNVEYSNSDIKNLIKLASGRLDLIFIDKAQAEYYLKTELTELRNQVEAIYPVVETIPQYLGISKRIKDGEKLADDFNTGLLQITKSGLLNKIREKHGY